MSNGKNTKASRQKLIKNFDKTVTASSSPVIVSTSNITDRKMTAISDLCAAIKECAITLSSTNVSVEITNCTINNAKKSGISVQNEK
jgi:hypothetical protein